MIGREEAEQAWRQQSVWSQTADRLKRRIERARLAALSAVVAVAVAATAATSMANAFPMLARLLAGVAAAGSAVLPLLRPGWSGAALKDWTRARSVSEALKSEVYLWLARVGRYQHDDQGEQLQERASKLLVDAADLEKHHYGIKPRPRDLPEVHDPTSFFSIRVNDQICKYYEPKIRKLGRRLRQLRWVETALGAVGLVLGAFAAITAPTITAWVAVVATVGTAFAVHIAATRYEFQEIEFARTAARLRQLEQAAKRLLGNSSKLGDLAIEAESVISIENQGWMAKLAEEPPEQKAPAQK